MPKNTQCDVDVIVKNENKGADNWVTIREDPESYECIWIAPAHCSPSAEFCIDLGELLAAIKTVTGKEFHE